MLSRAKKKKNQNPKQVEAFKSTQIKRYIPEDEKNLASIHCKKC